MALSPSPEARAERLRALLQPLEAEGDRADGEAELSLRVRQRIERDLLARDGSARPELVVGIVGPNNAGKSSLFNALAGRRASAVRATGGATRRLVGVAGTETARQLLGPRAALGAAAGRALGPFVFVPFDPSGGGDTLALEAGADPAELCLAEAPRLPEGVLLVDSPDFDSAGAGHRQASEALAMVADVALVVVTKGSYLNASVVDYLVDWVGEGRPWICLLNQSTGAEAAERQIAELTARVGREPLAGYHATLELELQEGRHELAPKPLRDAPPLAAWLATGERRAHLARLAREASLRGLAGDLRELVQRVRQRAEVAARIDAVARRHGERGAHLVVQNILPSEPLVAAFRTVLDRRGGVLHRGVRGSARWVGQKVGLLPRLVLGKRAPKNVPAPNLVDLERARLERHWLDLLEPLARDLGAERRAPEAKDAGAALAAALSADLGRAPWALRDEALRALAEAPLDFEHFEERCEALVEEELERRGGEWLLQSGSTLLALLPVGGAAVAIVFTGGMGADIAVAGGGVASYWLYDQLVALLGRPLLERARLAWEGPRAALLARILFGVTLPTAGPVLQEHQGAAAWAAELEVLGAELVP